MRLKDKVAIVTGSSPHIGGAVAKAFASEGARVACNDIHPAIAEDCAQEIRQVGGTAIAVAGDVTEEGCADSAVEQVLEKWGRIDVLVNNAVIFNVKGILDMSLGEYRHQLDVILSGAFLCTRAVARAMIQLGNGGSIINLLSGAAWQGQPGNIGYSTGKGGLVNFTRSAAMELAEYRIRVNGITPTATARTSDLEDHGRVANDRYLMDFEGMIPLGRLPTTRDYVPAFLYLASDESSMVTGTHIAVDGGAQAKYWPWIVSRSRQP